MYTDPQVLYNTTLSLDMNARDRYVMHWYHHYTDTVVHWTWYYIIHWPLLVHVLVIHRYVTRLIATHICSTGTRIYPFTEYRMSYSCYHRYMDARYTVMLCLHITVTHACIVSIFLSYGSTVYIACIFRFSCYMIISRSWYWISCYWIHELLICDVWNPTSIVPVSRYPVLCYQLSSGPVIMLHVPCTVLVLVTLCTLNEIS